MRLYDLEMTLTLGFTIRIFAAAAEMEGLRLVEKSNWSGKGVVCPRALLRAARSRNEFAKPAVYILTGPSEDSALTRIYVGEGDPVGPRLDNHAAKKDFWTSLILFCAKDDNLNKAHIQHLEARLVALARKAQRAELDNSNTPELPTLSEAESAEAEGFLAEMLLCLPLIGVQAFEQAESLRSQSEPLELIGKGIRARGYDTAGGFLVKKGSQAVSSVVPSTHQYIRDLRRVLLQQGVFADKGTVWELTKDHQFDSPTAAASALLGKSTNGRIRWKNKLGKTLRELQDATAGGTPKEYRWN